MGKIPINYVDYKPHYLPRIPGVGEYIGYIWIYLTLEAIVSVYRVIQTLSRHVNIGDDKSSLKIYGLILDSS